MPSDWSSSRDPRRVMRWEDEGFVLSARRWGETSRVVQLLTGEHGRHAGLVRSGGIAGRAHVCAPGDRVKVRWSGRLPEHLGHFVCELIDPRAGRVLHQPLRLIALSSVCALAEWFLAEREPTPAVHAAGEAVLDRLAGAGDWQRPYVAWELLLLRETGAGLDLGRCAVTGSTDDLTHVSPKTGRAVSRSAAAPWAPRLLPLPPFLQTGAAPGREEVRAALRLTGHFLRRNAIAHGRRALPSARLRLADGLEAEAGTVAADAGSR